MTIRDPEMRTATRTTGTNIREELRQVYQAVYSWTQGVLRGVRDINSSMISFNLCARLA